MTPERLAVSWLLAQRGVTCAVLGASRASQLSQVLLAGETKLDDRVLGQLETITHEFRFGDAPPL
ncbi:Aldo/keto reductase family protein [compost metagenome]